VSFRELTNQLVDKVGLLLLNKRLTVYLFSKIGVESQLILADNSCKLKFKKIDKERLNLAEYDYINIDNKNIKHLFKYLSFLGFEKLFFNPTTTSNFIIDNTNVSLIKDFLIGDIAQIESFEEMCRILKDLVS
jgi:hypothetical protein